MNTFFGQYMTTFRVKNTGWGAALSINKVEPRMKETNRLVVSQEEASASLVGSVRVSSNGKTPAFQAVNLGSSPSTRFCQCSSDW